MCMYNSFWSPSLPPLPFSHPCFLSHFLLSPFLTFMSFGFNLWPTDFTQSTGSKLSGGAWWAQDWVHNWSHWLSVPQEYISNQHFVMEGESFTNPSLIHGWLFIGPGWSMAGAMRSCLHLSCPEDNMLWTLFHFPAVTFMVHVDAGWEKASIAQLWNLWTAMPMFQAKSS